MRRSGMACRRSPALTAAVLLLSACSNGAGEAPRSAHSIVTGIVYSAPSCPVERAESPCPPRPLAGAEVAAYSGPNRRGATHTGVDGRFQLDLTYGHYTIRATNVGGLASTASTDVDVSAVPTSVELTVDSGIR